MLGNKFGLGKEFDKAFMLIGTMALTMIGMIVISPIIAKVLLPVSGFFANVLHIDQCRQLNEIEAFALGRRWQP